MKLIKNGLAVIGFLVVVLAIAGNVGIGHFRLYYGPDPVSCTNSKTGQPVP